MQYRNQSFKCFSTCLAPPYKCSITFSLSFWIVWYVTPLSSFHLIRSKLRHPQQHPDKKQGKIAVLAWPIAPIGAILTQWRRPVASSEALDLLHWAMCVVTYRCIAMAIKTASKVRVFLHHCFICCCPDSCWGDTEQVVAKWRRPVASGIALDMLHWGMCFVLHRRTAMAIKMTCNGGTFVCHCWFCH